MRRSIVMLAFALGCEAEDEWFPESSYVSESIQGHTLVEGVRVRIRFDGNEELTVSPGCNYMPGTYRLSGDLFIVEGLGTSEAGCDTPRMLQDEWMRDFVLGSPAYEINGPRLILRDDEVTLVLLDDEVADPDRPLVGPVWQIESLVDGGFAFAWGYEDRGTLIFGADGHLAIDGPCASGAGDYVTDDALLSFEDVAIDPPQCPDEEAARSIDEHLRELFVAGPFSYEIDASRLTIGDGSFGLVLRTN